MHTSLCISDTIRDKNCTNAHLRGALTEKDKKQHRKKLTVNSSTTFV